MGVVVVVVIDGVVVADGEIDTVVFVDTVGTLVFK